MSRINHVFKELTRNVWRNLLTTFSTFMVMTLLFLLFDLFWIAAGTSDRVYKDFLSDLQMEVFIAEEAADSTISALQTGILSIPGVNEVEYISREIARQQLAMMVGVDLLVGYDTANPLPRSLILSFDDNYLNTEQLNEIESQIAGINNVAQIYYSKNWLGKVEKTRTIITRVGLILGSLILLTVLFSSTSSMSLTTRARASGFEQMRLLGAGKMFLAFPFLIEGIIIGCFSAAAGWGIILYLKGRIDFSQVEIIFPSYLDITYFCLLAGLLGLISGYLGIRKMLKL